MARRIEEMCPTAYLPNDAAQAAHRHVQTGPEHVQMGPESPVVETGVASDTLVLPSSSRGVAASVGSAGPVASAGADLADQLEDEMFAAGVCGHALQDMQRREEQALRRPATARQPLPPVARDLALRFLQHFCELMSLPPGGWYEAANLLDIYARRAPRGLAVENLPLACVTLVKLLKKFDTSNCMFGMRGYRLSEHAARLVALLRFQGLPANEPSESDIDEEEVRVLEALSWQISLPTIESWMSAHCRRFDVLTRGWLAPSVEWVWKHSDILRRAIVMQQATSEVEPPRLLACGLLGLTFVKARLIRLEALRPATVEAAAWEQLFVATQPDHAIPTCVLQREHELRVLGILETASGCSLSEIQKAAQRVATILGAFMQDEMHQQLFRQATGGTARTTP